MGLADKLKELEEELARTQKNKATEFHIGILKSKIAKIKKELAGPKKSAKKSSGFSIKKSGDATVALVGLPSTGKSTLLNALTGAKSKTAHYSFTTLNCIPGILNYKGAKIQILDLPGIIAGAKDGVGRGKEVISAAKSADLILLVLDVFDPFYREKLVSELYASSIRLDSSPPKISLEKKKSGGVSINSLVKEQGISNETIVGILKEYGIFNANLILHEKIFTDDLIDFLDGSRVYIPSLTVINKIDLDNSVLKKLEYDFIAVSAQTGEGLTELKEKIFQKLNLIRVYTKSKFNEIDNVPLMIKKGQTIADVCKKLHKELYINFKYALVWGKSVKYPAQKVGLNHVLEDEDIIQIIKK
ncbi:MAG: GTP-binding protein [Candidatus Omnitrophica bacterium]|nr:GTP-binding protein [Candidatus Omnitrophota bacterium]